MAVCCGHDDQHQGMRYSAKQSASRQSEGGWPLPSKCRNEISKSSGPGKSWILRIMLECQIDIEGTATPIGLLVLLTCWIIFMVTVARTLGDFLSNTASEGSSRSFYSAIPDFLAYLSISVWALLIPNPQWFHLTFLSVDSDSYWLMSKPLLLKPPNGVLPFP